MKKNNQRNIKKCRSLTIHLKRSRRKHKKIKLQRVSQKNIQNYPVNSKPQYTDTIKHFYEKLESLHSNKVRVNTQGIYFLPSIFSLSDNYNESCYFIKTLFHVLYNQSNKNITLDYTQCNRIDIDASVLMDILLGEFITHYKKCRKYRCKVSTRQISAKNYENNDKIKKILFSIGAFSSIKGVQIRYDNIIPYPLRFILNKAIDASKTKEIHTTQIVDYVLDCIKKMKRILTEKAEKKLFNIVGEILTNAMEHSSGDKTFSVGYFQDDGEDAQRTGIFHLVILNFGKTIYEIFKDPDCPNKKVVKEMQSLSKEYTQKYFFKKAEFEEASLWTLYALQEGVTSKADWKRGNGTICFIDNFFQLKGNQQKDGISSLSILSGNTKIMFDGTYQLHHKEKNGETFKMMTFNKSGEINELPDKKYVTFVNNYFPGTLISAKICLKHASTESNNT